MEDLVSDLAASKILRHTLRCWYTTFAKMSSGKEQVASGLSSSMTQQTMRTVLVRQGSR